MKKIYLSVISCFIIAQVSTAQTLTQAANQPTVGDMNSYKGYDSTGVVPKNTGSGVTWNFSAYTQNTLTAASLYTTASSVPSSSAFPGATLAEDQGASSYNFYKVTGTQLELLGSSTPGSDFTFTNSAVVANFPVGFGYSVTDNFSGNLTGAAPGTANGTITTLGSGTGTVVLPGGQTLSNILQVKVQTTIAINITFPPLTATIISTDYSYYHSSQKFPVVMVNYQTTTGFQNSASAEIRVNNAVITGLNEKNFDATFQIFPNPAKDAFNVNLNNASNEHGVIEIYNSLGQLTQVIDLGSDSVIERNVSLNGLSSGIYVVKTTFGSRTSSRKLIVE